MAILVTGAAGFIGYHLSVALLARGEQVVGVDNINSYYDVALKQARLARLNETSDFAFLQRDITADETFREISVDHPAINRVVHLAAQAGVRHSIEHPFDYIQANLVGHTRVLEYCRHLPACEHLVYASSSSVYGGNTKLPFSVDDRVDRPISLYAATKRADELMSYAYSHLYDLPQTGLRFFTVYGPWGRPDMAMFKFTKALFAGDPISLYNNGDIMRDFTYVDDIVAGIIAVLDSPPSGAEGAPYKVYNIGNNRSEPLMRVIELLQACTGRTTELVLEPMQPGDVQATYADIEPIRAAVGFEPRTSIDQGIPNLSSGIASTTGSKNEASNS
jgi:UDP-glucuronate 4-epimerase